METKLTTITPSYRSFVPDQILTAGQLNEFLNYFEDQDRLSRIFLSGVGIVCGFKIGFNANSNGELVISQGAGVSTDGDFFKLSKPDTSDPELENIDISELRFTHYRAFDDSNAKYKPFFWKTINGSDVQINLWEAVPSDQVIPSDQTIISRPDLEKLVVLLYLESYPEDPSACTGIDCENLGIKNIRKLRVLFVSNSDAEYILSNDSIFNANYLISTYLNLDEVALQRVTVNATNSASFATLRSNYLSAIQAENTIEKLKNGFTSMLGKLGMSSEASFISNGLAQLFGNGANYPQLYFQYRYDLLRDIVNTYNELKDIFMDSICSCNPSIRSFPKHLMLGRLVPVQEDQYLKKYRHDFYKSPILKDEKNWCERFKLYVQRTIEMLSSFNTEIGTGEIRITPSSYRSPIEDKAIPFYYGTQNFQRLLDTWNYDKYKVHKQNRNLSYHKAFLDPSGPIQFPLNYNLEPHNFLNIEGHQGYTYQVAMQQIDNLKKQYGLAFDTKALGITINVNDPINMADYACHFEDLQIMLDAWTQEHECLLGKVSKYYSAFSTIDPTQNYLVEEYIYPTVASVSTNDPELRQSVNNVVKDNLYTAEESLGVVMLPVFDQFQGCSGNDIAIQVDRQIDRFNYGVEMKDIVEATLKGPNEVLAHAYVMMDKRPATLADVLPSVVQSVNASATNLCGAARKTFTRAVKVNLEKEVRTMLYNLAQDSTAICCSAEKLQLIYEEIERRKKDILIGLSLAKFQEQHPGMEHLAGAHQGDTFLLVYIRNAVNGIAANTVIADFTLPYLCCSDCRPVGFIMPEVVADLRLSSSKICLKAKENAIIEMYRYPTDGVVEIIPSIPGLSAVGDQLKIDSTKIPETAYGQTIHFTLNGHQTNAELTLNKATEATLIAPPNPITSLAVTFDCQLLANTNPNDFTYFWDFGDGTTATIKSPTHTYSAPINMAMVKLTVASVTGDDCPLTTERVLQFDINNNWPPDPVVCKLESGAYLAAQKAQYEQILSEMGLGGAAGGGLSSASASFQGTIENFTKFYADLNDDMPGYQAGNYNNTVGPNVQGIANGLFEEIVLNHAEGASVAQLVQLYHNLMRSSISIARCQEENMFIQSPIISMINTFTNQMNPAMSPSLPSMNIASGTPDNFNFLNEVLTQREKNSGSWKAVTSLLSVVVWKP
ncbi:hypothetical protein D3C87_151240 [compost metagenome]